MADEMEIVVAGIALAFFGLLLIISPVAENLFTVFTGIKGDNLVIIKLVSLFGGISLTVVASVSKKSR